MSLNFDCFSFEQQAAQHDCLASHSCVDSWETARDWLVFSNLVFLFPPMVLYRVRKASGFFVVPVSDDVFMLSCIGLCIVSSLYHACDSMDNMLPCGEKCVVGWQQLYHADMLISGFMAHAASTLGWEPDTQLAQAALHLSWAFFPYAAVFMIHDDVLYVSFVVALCLLDVSYRYFGERKAVLRFPVVVSVTAALGAFTFGVTAVLLQYTGIVGDERNRPATHTAWHFAMGSALCLVPVVFIDDRVVQLEATQKERTRTTEPWRIV